MSEAAFNQERLEELLLASGDGSFGGLERDELNMLLRDDAHARAFASRFLVLDAALADQLGAEAMEQRFAAENSANSEKIIPFSLARRALIGSAALFLLLALAIPFLREEGRDDNTIAATVQRTDRASGFTTDDTLRPGDPIRFERGRVVLRFRSGARLATQGPAEIRITGDNSAEMTRGRATIRVPGKIKGFTLDTPAEQVVDLGTSFGVAVAESGTTSIAVFEGEIELRGEQHSGGPQRLLAGASVQVENKNKSPSAIPYQFGDYLDTWRDSFGIDVIEGDLRIANPGERQNPGEVVDASQLLLFPEQESVLLPRGFSLSTIDPGTFDNEQKPRAAKREVALTAPLVVDSYLLQFNPGAEESRNQPRRFSGHLRFDRPIVGLLLSKAMLDESDAILALPSSNYEGIFRRGINAGDQVVLAQDRHSLRISFSIQDGVDQIRVLVASEPDLN